MTNPQAHDGSPVQGKALLTAATHLTDADRRFQKYLDGTLSAVESKVLNEHLAVCPECAALCRVWLDLDTELEQNLHRPQLSETFATGLWQRIEAEAALINYAERQERRQQLEAESTARWFEFRRCFLRAQWPRLIESLAYGTAAALAGYYLLKLGVGSLPEFATPLAVATAATAVVAGAWLAASTHIARWLVLLGLG